MASHRYPRDLFGEIGVPDMGMDTDTVPRLMSPRKAPLIKNFLMDRPGVLPMRGPLCEGTAWNNGSSIGLRGAWVFDDKLMVNTVQASATATRDYWVAPYRKATAGTQLRTQTSGVFKYIDLTAGTVTTMTVAVPALRRNAVRVGQYVYGFIDSGGNTPITQDGYVYPLGYLARWDGTSGGGAFTFYFAANAPFSAQDIAYHYNRLFVLGGAPAAGTRIQFNSLYWSDPFADGAPLPAAVTAWQDDVSGLINQLVVGSDDQNDFGVALAHVGPNLCILKRRSMWMLYGTAPSNFQVKQVSNEVGCIDPRSVIEYNGGVYFMSERGFMFYDGARVQSVSTGLNNSLVANAIKQVGPAGVDGGYVRAVLLVNGYILVTTGVMDGATLTTTADTDAWLLHAPSGAWTQFSSGALPAIIAAGRSVNNTYLLTDQKLVKANYLFTPQNAPAGTRGFDSIDSGATKFVIPSRWTTRALELSAPTTKSKLQRIMAEYYWGLANGGWTVTATTRGDTGVASPSAVLGAPTTVAANLPARGTMPVFNESDEVYLDVAATSSAPAAFNDAELHRLLVEYEPTGNTVPV